MPGANALTPLGLALDRARRARKMTVTAVAKAADSNRVSWYRVVQGLPCREVTVLRMAAAVGMSPRRAIELVDRPAGPQADEHDLDLSHLAEENNDEIRDRLDLCLEELAHRSGSRAAARPLANVPTDDLRRCVEGLVRELCRRAVQRTHTASPRPPGALGRVRS